METSASDTLPTSARHKRTNLALELTSGETSKPPTLSLALPGAKSSASTPSQGMPMSLMVHWKQKSARVTVFMGEILLVGPKRGGMFRFSGAKVLFSVIIA